MSSIGKKWKGERFFGINTYTVLNVCVWGWVSQTHGDPSVKYSRKKEASALREREGGRERESEGERERERERRARAETLSVKMGK
jgi:hypothetical protein